MRHGEDVDPLGLVPVEQSVWKAMYLPTPKHPPNRTAGFGMLAYEDNRSPHRFRERTTEAASLPIVERNRLAELFPRFGM